MSLSARSLLSALALSLLVQARSDAQPVSETVDAIMARQQARGDLPHGPRVKEERLAAYRAALPQNPDSPATAQSAGGDANVALQGAASAPPQKAGTSFLAIQLAEAPFFPPDTQMAIGPAQILAAANGRLKVFDRNGVLGPLNADIDLFFRPVTGNGTTDPRVRFDRLSGRWFVTSVDLPRSKKNNSVLIAVSDGATITGSSSFTFHAFQQSSAAPAGDTGWFADYPTLGIDRHALYIGCNMFSSSFFAGTTGFVINKSNLLAGTLTVTAFRQLAGGSGPGPYTPQGVDNDDPESTEGYFIGIDSSAKGRLIVRRVSNPGGVPTISGNLNITVPTTTRSLGSVPNLGGGGLSDLDDRLFAAMLKHGSLWTAHNIQVNAGGVADSAGGRDGSRWYEITNLTSTPTLRQSGTVMDPAASSPASYWIPSCAMTGQGHVALGCSTAGNNLHAQIAVAGRFATDPLGTMSSPVIVQTTPFTYNVSAAPQRWGDYSVMVVDPLDDMTLWTAQEYCNANNSWGTRVIQLKAPPPAIPTGCSPSAVPSGTNVNLLITGTASGGSGFFDPGPAYPRHLGAKISGADVIVNAATYIDPVHVSLNVSVLAGASTGARSISITNPDGQTVTSAVGFFTITPGDTSVTNQAPVLTSVADQVVNEGGPLTFTVVGNDPDGNALTFALDHAPPGASIDTATGVFNWTPTEAQGPAAYLMAVRVMDNGAPSLSATQTFRVTVKEVNVAPAITTIPNRVVHAGETVSLVAIATDADLPANGLGFALEPGAPAGAGMTAAGVFSWAPTAADIGSHPISVRVTDDGDPPASDVTTFSVDVAPPPAFTGVTRDGPSVTLRWTALAGRGYQLQSSSVLAPSAWNDVPGIITALSDTAQHTELVAGGQRFYRVRVVP